MWFLLFFWKSKFLKNFQTDLTLSRESLIEKFTKQKLLIKKGQDEAINLGDILKSKLVAFYFDADWCSPGQKFLVKLNQIYMEARIKKIDVELIYVSYDDDEKICFKCYNKSHGNWLMWPYEKKSIR